MEPFSIESFETDNDSAYFFVIQVFDHMIQRNERLARGLRGGDSHTPDVDGVSDKSVANNGEGGVSDVKTEPGTDPVSGSKEKEELKFNNDEPLKALDQQVVEWNQKLVSENKNLHQVRKKVLSRLIYIRILHKKTY